MKKLLIYTLLISLGLYACKPGDPKNHDDHNVVVDEIKPMQEVAFNADSAYGYVSDQVAFGPRVPGSGAHQKAGDWLQSKLTLWCDTVYVQHGIVPDFKNEQIKIRNIIGVFNPNAKRRILLSAHWDTRPQADEDPQRPQAPADGANDGGSGVAVLLEIARHLHTNRPGLGIDIILFDAEDGGERKGASESWCLGSQYWSKGPHIQPYTAEFGILLDMVGAKDAIFPRELHSQDFAREYVDLVWNTGVELGYGKYFVNDKGSHITDDHYYINSILGVRTIDILQYNAGTQSGFGEYWHTHNDNMSVIDRNTLKAVGHTVLETIRKQHLVQ